MWWFVGCSRTCPQKSLTINHRKKYGPAKIKYPLFRNREIDEVKSFVLRNAGGNFGASHFRDPLMHSLISELDVEKQAYRPAVVYLNGQYWGIMNIREKINEHYFESHFGVTPDNLDMLENEAEIIHGDNADYLALQTYLQTADMSQPQSYDYIKTQIDLDDYLDYLTSEIYFANVDWPGWNLKYWRQRNPHGKWRWIIFDLDDGFGWGKPQDYGFRNMFDFATTTAGDEWPNPPWATLMLRTLLQNEQFEQDLLNRFADNLNTVWQAERVLATIDSIQNGIANEMPRHIARWQSEFTAWQMSMENWQEFVASLRDFGRNRPDSLRQIILEEYNLAGVADLDIEQDPLAGQIRLNHNLAVVDSIWQGKYFAGIPVKLTAEANPGFLFKNWSGAVTADTPEITINFSDSAAIAAHFVIDNSAIPAIVINEINYHSAADFPAGDWL